MAGAGYRVVATSALPLDVPSVIGSEVSYFEPELGHLDRDALLGVVGDAEGVIALLTDAVDAELLAAAPRLRVVANFAVGVDNVDIARATARSVVVTNTPDVLTEATADFTFALLLAAARRLVEGDRWVRRGTWPGWEPTQLLGADVSGRTLGIIGLGRIGRAVARRARGFSMNVLYAGRPGAEAADRAGARAVPMAALLAESDFVSIHCPLNEATGHIIDAGALEAMKSTAILINTARGGCVDEQALAAGLERGAIAGAGLDVFEREPAVEPGLLSSQRVVLAPHAGSATNTARRRMAEICAQAVRAVLDGRRPETVVNPEVFG